MWIALGIAAVVLVSAGIAVLVEYWGNRANPGGGKPTGTTLSRVRQARRDVESIDLATSTMRNPPWRYKP